MTSPTVKSRHREDLRVITDVFYLEKEATYGESGPILDDPAKDLFISSNYSGFPMMALFNYGLQSFPENHFLALLETNLRDSNSKIHGMSEDWHSALANYLCSWFDQGLSEAGHLKNLPMIPLRDGKWTSATLGPVYLSMTEGVIIPENLDIRVIKSTATSDTARRRLYDHLGVSEADVLTVRASVLRACTFLLGLSLPNSKAYLHYLYLTHRPGISGITELEQIAVMDDRGNGHRPHQTDTYLPGRTHSFSPESLLAPNGPVPGFFIPFIDTAYMENSPVKPAQGHPSWEKWLIDFVGIQERLRLVDHTEESLSETVLYVHEHLPEQFLGLLKYLWRSVSSSVRTNQILRRNIKALSAKNLCGVSYDISLGDTWLPFKNLCDHVSLYMETSKDFPFLKIDSTGPADKFSLEWSFLAEFFEVRKEDNLAFYMDVLRYIRKSHPYADGISVSQGQKIYDIYSAIYATLTLSRNKAEDQRTIK